MTPEYVYIDSYTPPCQYLTLFASLVAAARKTGRGVFTPMIFVVVELHPNCDGISPAPLLSRQV